MEFEIGDNAGFEGLLDEKTYLEYVENLDEDDHWEFSDDAVRTSLYTAAGSEQYYSLSISNLKTK